MVASPTPDLSPCFSCGTCTSLLNELLGGGGTHCWRCCCVFSPHCPGVCSTPVWHKGTWQQIGTRKHVWVSAGVLLTPGLLLPSLQPSLGVVPLVGLFSLSSVWVTSGVRGLLGGGWLCLCMPFTGMSLGTIPGSLDAAGVALGFMGGGPPSMLLSHTIPPASLSLSGGGKSTMLYMKAAVT